MATSVQVWAGPGAQLWSSWGPGEVHEAQEASGQGSAHTALVEVAGRGVTDARVNRNGSVMDMSMPAGRGVALHHAQGEIWVPRTHCRGGKARGLLTWEVPHHLLTKTLSCFFLRNYAGLGSSLSCCHFGSTYSPLHAVLAIRRWPEAELLYQAGSSSPLFLAGSEQGLSRILGPELQLSLQPVILFK